MCYGVKARTEMNLRIAKSRGDKDTVAALEKLLDPIAEADLHFANGFTHPHLVVYTDAAPRKPEIAHWGLVPTWTKDAEQARTLRVRTLNARSESMFEKPAFRSAAQGQRCLLFVEGFYEHHHFGKRAYPYFIHLRERPHFALAALWDTWTDPATGADLRTCSIVTTSGNDLLRRIHNDPKSQEPRMPVILAAEEEEQWLAPLRNTADEAALQALIRPYPADAMTAHPVRPLLGKQGCGNAPGASDEFFYPELQLVDPLG